MAQYTKVSSTCRARNFLRKTINANEKKEGAKNDPCGTPENTAWAEITSCVVDDYLLSSVRKIASSSYELAFIRMTCLNPCCYSHKMVVVDINVLKDFTRNASFNSEN